MGVAKRRFVETQDDTSRQAWAMAIPKSATLDDGRIVDVVEWAVYCGVHGPIEVTLRGYVRRESVAQSHQDCAGRERTG